jgi:2-keto-4-pentenoate hydratase/2-oxohepta-3-ene-1,7-dioic acid hydratase in catechol pathway
MLGHGSLVPIFGDRAFAQLALAVVLGDSLSSATAEDAERAVFGVTLLNGWASSESPASDGYLTRYTAPQLGPGLVTLDEIGDAGDTGSLGALRAQIRIDGVPVRRLDTRGQPFTLGEALASISRSFELRAGDVVSLGVLRAGTIEVPFGATVELAVERIGRLAGTPVRAT